MPKKRITRADFMVAVRDTYREMQDLYRECRGEEVSYPDFEAAMDQVEREGFAD